MFRSAITLATGAAVLVLVNLAIVEKERVLADGRVVLLEVAPVDPRSIMQGDYMALRFRAEDGVRGADVNRDGDLVVTVDERGVGTFARIDDGRPLAPGELRLRFRVRNGQVKFATNAFFFEEGTAARYAAAQYGEFRVDEDGELLLTGLRGRDLEPLGPQPAQP
jgi:uncharacterized membrane-anchored protein